MAVAPIPVASEDDADAVTRPWPRASYAWGIAIMLGLASAFSHADRTVMSLTVTPVKAEFGLDDTHFGMLQGLAFGLFYMVCSIPIGRLADTYQRRIVIGISLGFFSLFAMASGLARSFTQLFITRVGVGVGEASVTPTGMSLLTDLFPPEKLGRAASLFFLSTPLGLGLSLIAGGKLLTELNYLDSIGDIPFGLAPWQAAFILVGFPGLLLAPFFLTIREPERRGKRAATPLSIRQVLSVMNERRRVLALMFAGFSMVPLVNIAFNVWTPALFERVYGWTPAEVGLGFGLLLITCGVSGVIFAGWVCDRLAQAGYKDAQLLVAALCYLPCGLFAACAPLMPTAWGALALLAPALFLSNVPLSCAGVAFQLILPNRCRAQVTGVFIMLTGLVGQGFGPVLIGYLNDTLFTGQDGIRYTMAIVVGAAAPIMSILVLAARPSYRRARAADDGLAASEA